MLHEVSKQIVSHIKQWEAPLMGLLENQLTQPVNDQGRNIKQILGHMVDSASNNTHRIIHLQYQASPISFPDYANLGNNDRWITIQNYSTEDWVDLVQLWKYSHLHLTHVISNINELKLKSQWLSALNEKVSLEEMILDFPRHMELHLSEIESLIDKN